METLTIPVGRPLTFDELRALNRGVPVGELVDAFRGLPPAMQEQAWSDLELRTALDDWGEKADGSP